MLEKNFSLEASTLCIGGVAVTDLKEKYSTPLYIYDQKLIKETGKLFVEKFKSDFFKTEVIYASKACSNIYLLGLLKELGLYIDCVSMGEIFIALRAGYDPKKIHFHGNNKSKEELIYAINKGIGLIILDSYAEFKLVEECIGDKKIDVLLRINPDVQTDTHKFIQTSNADSKFGVSIRDGKIIEIIKEIASSDKVNLLGFHAHIGSQVVKEEFFMEEAEILLKFTKKIQQATGLNFSNLNLGGGFGVNQKMDDEYLDLEKFLPKLIKYVEEKAKELGITLDSLGIEPGRSLINQAGSTLYTVGSVKHTLEGYPLVFVDGGMSDNIRPCLYEAEYDACIANKMLDEEVGNIYRVGGKLCESGDILIKEVKLKNPSTNDLLLIPSTGAYSLAMSSNYNKALRPAVVFVEDGKDYLAVKRESLEDLVKNDMEYGG